MFGSELYLLREDGLLYSWSQSKEVVENRVQTSFSTVQNRPWKDKSSYLEIKDGIIFVNCTHLPHSRIYMYALNLSYLGLIELKSSQYGIEADLIN